MAIGNAIQKGSFVHVYDEKGKQTASIPTSSKLGEGLMGYTSSTVNIKNGGFISTYDEKGHKTGSKAAK